MTSPPDDDRSARPLDLTLERFIDAPPALVWQAWTEPEHLKKWWAPAPLTTPDCEMEVRPGGLFRTLMRAPDGTEYDSSGCFLEVVEPERIVFTDALVAGFRPAEEAFFTAIITLDPHDGGTRYIARALHKNDADRQRHERMGFHEGWGTCVGQLAELAVQLKEAAR
jgi:uncharacterized protein YndB with AHSA1/START domain